MALLHRAELRPSKLDLISKWAPAQPWFRGEAGAEFEKIDAFRLDDPEGEVGIETLFVRAGDGAVLQIPLTYRGAPLAGGERWFLGTMEHSVLGTRYTYDGAGDSAYIAAVVTAIRTGGREAEQFFDVDGALVKRESTALAMGTGADESAVLTASDAASVGTRSDRDTTISETAGLELTLVRVLRDDNTAVLPVDEPGTESLVGTWLDQPEHTTLAAVRSR